MMADVENLSPNSCATFSVMASDGTSTWTMRPLLG